jgi:hypothetical protein
MNDEIFRSGLNPLKWNVFEKSEKEELWPKRTIGASLVYLEEKEKYLLIGGNFNVLENSNKNFKLNKELIAGVEKNINDFFKLENKKLDYLAESVANNSQNLKIIDIYVYELKPVRKWYKISSLGRVPRAKSFHKCVAISKNFKIFILFTF